MNKQEFKHITFKKAVKEICKMFIHIFKHTSRNFKKILFYETKEQKQRRRMNERYEKAFRGYEQIKHPPRWVVKASDSYNKKVGLGSLCIKRFVGKTFIYQVYNNPQTQGISYFEYYRRKRSNK